MKRRFFLGDQEVELELSLVEGKALTRALQALARRARKSPRGEATAARGLVVLRLVGAPQPSKQLAIPGSGR